ncbi:hypothetical protein GOBAR_DD00130 [Gossypium barbadense]|nr:hypothetical protein GOBAR_DD00130 [Gossypium barbadense]
MEGLVWEFERNPEKAPIEDDTSSIEEIMVIEDACNNEIRQDLEEVLRHEELLWFQKSRPEGLQNGDRNISYFHNRTLARRGEFFNKLYNTNYSISGVLYFRGKFPLLSNDETSSLLLGASDEEVRRAVFGMAPLRAPRVDGFQEPVVVEKEDSGSDNVLACPICYDPLTWTVGSPSYVGSKSGSNLQCKTCKKSYFGNQTHLDLVASGGSKQYDNSMPLATELFRTPVVSFLYERGWRQNFIFGGFPGPGKEFEMAKKYLKPVLGGNIVDASCGSGLFSRLFAKSGLFSQVVALDYSENMLRQSMKRGKLPRRVQKKVTLVRADISRLPFKSSSVDALHAGAALHCWPSPSTAVDTQKVKS